MIKIKIESVEHSHVGGVGGVELVRGEVLYCTRMPPSTPSVVGGNSVKEVRK